MSSSAGPSDPHASQTPTVESLIKETNDSLRAFLHFEQAPFPLAVLRGPEYVVELANAPALKAWGKDARVIGMTLLEAIPELEGQPFVGYLDEVVRSGVTYRGLGELARLQRMPGGPLEDVYFDLAYSALRSPEGEIDGILVSGFEVTDRVLATREREQHVARIEAEERAFRELVDNLPELAWTARADGQIDFFNRRWFEYTGTEFADVKGTGWHSVQDPEQLAEVDRRWRASVASGEPFETERRLRGRDGNYRWFLSRARPIKDADGNVLRWIGMSTDIDERRRIDDFREMFLGVLGHDLRNPLSAILTTARLLRMKQPPEVHPQLDRMIRSGTRMQKMIEQILDMTRARLAGGISLHQVDEPILLEPVVAKIVDEIRGAAPDQSIELDVQGAPRARIDNDRFEQVVSNLIGNAVTHGDKLVPVRVTLANEGDGTVRLTVENGGSPIDAAAVPTLFNPFARGRKPQGPSAGLGLGLYISERIVLAHGGRMAVRSTAAEGTRFDVYIPQEAS